jgi:hypothetical protein
MLITAKVKKFSQLITAFQGSETQNRIVLTSNVVDGYLAHNFRPGFFLGEGRRNLVEASYVDSGHRFHYSKVFLPSLEADDYKTVQDSDGNFIVCKTQSERVLTLERHMGNLSDRPDKHQEEFEEFRKVLAEQRDEMQYIFSAYKRFEKSICLVSTFI